MTSINIAIERMTRRATLSGILGAYLYATLIVAGPWIFTVLGLLNLSPTICDDYCTEKTIFRSIVIYNSMFSLIITTPLAFAGGRYASDLLHSKKTQYVFSAFNICVGLLAILTMIIIAPFYLIWSTLDKVTAVAGIFNALMIGCSWILIPCLGAARAYNTVLMAFLAGALAMFVSGAFLREPQASTLLVVFNVSFVIINLIMLAGLVRRFSSRNAVDPELTKTIKRKWELPAAGAAYALGLWIDKIIMWKADPSKGLVVAGVLQTMPSYDAAMFWAQLSSIPIIAVFFVHVETGFSAQIHSYHLRMQKQASLRELNEIVEKIASHVRTSMFELFTSLGVIASMMIILSFVFMTQLGLRPSYMGTFRISVASMAFYTSAIFCFNFLLHLDLRRQALLIVLTFLALNAALTLAILPLGPDFYGYGNLTAAAISLLIGFSLVQKEVSWLHYHAFVTNNSSI